MSVVLFPANLFAKNSDFQSTCQVLHHSTETSLNRKNLGGCRVAPDGGLARGVIEG